MSAFIPPDPASPSSPAPADPPPPRPGPPDPASPGPGMPGPAPSAPVRSARQRLSRRAGEFAALLVVAAIAVAVAIRATPMQTVDVAGQIITVGTTAPSWSLSGPGEVDLFGQSLPTTLQFPGPVRPRLALAEITINSELTNFVRGAKPAGPARGTRTGQQAGGRVETLFRLGDHDRRAGRTGPARRGGRLAAAAARHHHQAARGGLVITEAINVGAIVVSAARAPGLLRQVSSLNQLVGSEPPPPVHRKGRPLPQVQAVVMGDSTAAGEGLPAATGSSRLSRACGRSQDSYAQDLAAVNGWRVLNLACSNATIARGLLGPQDRHGKIISPQLASAERARNASVIIVNIGANDLGWAAMVGYCEVAPRCDDKATTAYFQQRLASFSKNYLQLLSQPATMPGHPRVIINQYYDPFGPQQGCLHSARLTPAKLATLTSRLVTLNAVLAKGATDFGFLSPQPDFAGHQLCTSQPYVQSYGDPAPFHPTALGQLAIALTDQAVLRG